MDATSDAIVLSGKNMISYLMTFDVGLKTREVSPFPPVDELALELLTIPDRDIVDLPVIQIKLRFTLIHRFTRRPRFGLNLSGRLNLAPFQDLNIESLPIPSAGLFPRFDSEPDTHADTGAGELGFANEDHLALARVPNIDERVPLPAFRPPDFDNPARIASSGGEW